MTRHSISHKKSPPSIWLLLFMVLGALLFFRLSWIGMPWLLPREHFGSPDNSDKIAAASALFSVLAFVGLVYAILLQRAELIIQHEEQAQLQRQVDEQERHLREQTLAIRQQNFENTFFHLLRLHNDNVRSQRVLLVHGGDVYSGRAGFAVASIEVQGLVAERLRDDPRPLTLDEVNAFYSFVCETAEADFGHYFRNLYHIIRYAKESSPGDANRYTSKVRAQLSQAEFELLFLNGLRKKGQSKFKRLIEEFALLHEMRLPIPYEKLRHFYKEEAFGKEEVLGD